MISTVRSRTILGVAAIALASWSAGPAEPAEPLLRLDATAVNMSGIGRARVERLQIVIERWSSDEERASLITTLIEKGRDSLMDAVQDVKPRAGFIRTTTSLGWDLKFARETPLPDGGRRIVFVTDRPIGFFEMRNGNRSRDYEFMVCEIRLSGDGKGVGKLGVSTKIDWDAEKKVIELENYGTEPVRLTEVRVEK